MTSFVSSHLDITGTAAAQANDVVIPATDVASFRYFSFQALSFGVATFNVQGSNDNSTWVTLSVINQATTAAAFATAITGNNVYIGPVVTRYIRVVCTAYTSGSPTGIMMLSAFSAPYISSAVAAAQSGTWTVTNTTASGSPTETTPTITNTTSTTLAAANATRKYLEIQNNSSGNIMISISGGTLTGIVPTSTNKGFVLYPGGVWTSETYIPLTAVTVYQSSGGTINTVSVAEG